jgi:excisionase family DNA binding protein
MQAYARARLTPLESESPQAPTPSISPASGPVVNGATAVERDTSSPVTALVSVIFNGLSDHDLGVLARRLLPHLHQPAEQDERRPVYTVASLAAELGVSQKTIRCAIGRHELVAVKRGARWLISADAVRDWATPPEVPARQRSRCVPAPRAAGPSLRSVLCAASGTGGRR